MNVDLPLPNIYTNSSYGAIIILVMRLVPLGCVVFISTECHNSHFKSFSTMMAASTKKEELFTRWF